MASDLRGTRKKWGCKSQWRRKGQSRATICTDIVLVGPELSTFSCDALEILLSRSVGITNLEKKTLFTNGLTVELPDDLFADLTILETGISVSEDTLSKAKWKFSPGEANTSAVVLAITKDSARTNSIVHEDSTKLLFDSSALIAVWRERMGWN